MTSEELQYTGIPKGFNRKGRKENSQSSPRAFSAFCAGQRIALRQVRKVLNRRARRGLADIAKRLDSFLGCFAIFLCPSRSSCLFWPELFSALSAEVLRVFCNLRFFCLSRQTKELAHG